MEKKRKGPEGLASVRRVQAAFRRQKALEMRRDGASYVEIQEALGYASHSGAYQAVRDALSALNVELTEEVRQLEVARLDRMLARLMPLIDRPDPDLGAMDRVLAIMARRSSFLGLDAPKKLEVDTNIDVFVREVAAKMGLDPADVLTEAEMILAEARSNQ